MRTIVAAVALLALAPLPARAEDPLPSQLEGVGIDQHMDAQVPVDLTFRDETGKTVVFGDLLGGKPTILNLVYYECPMLCTLVLNGLLSSLRALPFEVGKEFNIVTLSIDPGEGPELAAAKKKNVLAEYRRVGAEAGWRFLTGDEASIRRLAGAVGFRYTYDEETDLYAHAAGIVILTPRGKVARYFYGIDYAPRDVRLALIEASQNKIGTVVDQLLLFCYQYDPKSGKYSAATMKLVRTGAILTVLALVTFILLARRREARHARGAAA